MCEPAVQVFSALLQVLPSGVLDRWQTLQLDSKVSSCAIAAMALPPGFLPSCDAQELQDITLYRKLDRWVLC